MLIVVASLSVKSGMDGTVNRTGAFAPTTSVKGCDVELNRFAAVMVRL
jgi:hypothetical protein